jgi:hypothetical protein
MSFHRSSLRRWSARVLLLWLFGIGIGVVNACVLPMQGIGSPAGPVEVVCPDHDGDASGPTGDKGNCRQFCDQERVSIRPLKTGLDDVATHALALPASVVAWRVAAVPDVPRWTPGGREGVLAPPVPIAFLRLTL